MHLRWRRRSGRRRAGRRPVAARRERWYWQQRGRRCATRCERRQRTLLRRWRRRTQLRDGRRGSVQSKERAVRQHIHDINQNNPEKDGGWKPILGPPREPPLSRRHRKQPFRSVSMGLSPAYAASVAAPNEHGTDKRSATSRTIVSHRTHGKIYEADMRGVSRAACFSGNSGLCFRR